MRAEAKLGPFKDQETVPQMEYPYAASDSNATLTACCHQPQQQPADQYAEPCQRRTW